jgi:glutathione S-transferase
VITGDGEVIAESGAIIEYLVEKFGPKARGELSHLQPRPGTPEHRQCRFWMHYAEGSLMNWLLMKLVFQAIPRQRMPFFARPIARGICSNVQAKLIDPNLVTAQQFIEDHLGRSMWFAGDALTMADFQMSYAVEALLASRANADGSPNLAAFRARVAARPAYQRALEKGGPVIPQT